ncbi:YqhA family protein [Methylocystis bryophila]|uniref:UPF0114 protein B1812_17440 n=1 Tax=Methylocystis bryophila TaxID=655015 RepID=A0A1W6MYB9_9HYPH|nr:YqhA family protein [Methylocystis bryophila]ARN82575.1 hypothetical protein B1812_17440 [Methylocystis bryophila]BDV38785.1 UPF0114 protein [Methylocystis bryophila]
MLKRLFESYLLLTRWLLAPFLVLLTATQLALIYKGAKKALTLVFLLANGQDDHAALTVLNLVDITLTSALIVIVTISVYENFISRVTSDDRSTWPSWMGDIDFWQLKMKLLSTIVAITAIGLLESFIDVRETSDRDLYFYIGIHLTFVFSTVALAAAERLAGKHSPAEGRGSQESHGFQERHGAREKAGDGQPLY